MTRRTLAAAAAALSVLITLPACAPLLVGGAAVGTAMVATDRRSTGAIVEDQTIETRIAHEISQQIRVQGMHVSATSFAGKVLLSGEVPTDAVKEQVGRIAASVVNVKSVVNELAVTFPSSLGSRTNDSVILGKVRAAFIDEPMVSVNSIKVVVERGVVYLMGIVTEREAEAAAKAAARVGGVVSVVKLFNVESAAEINRRLGR